MKTHLTRRVFRSILANEPIVHHGCLRRRAFATASLSLDARSLTASRRCGLSTMRSSQRRTFFNFGIFGGQKKGVKDADLDPGMDVMQEFEKMKRMRARLPLPEDVADALVRFFESKSKQNQGLTDTQARLAYQSLQYYLHSGDGSEAAEVIQSRAFLKHAAIALGRVGPQPPTDAHADLARLLFRVTHKYAGGELRSTFHPATVYVKILTACGRTSEARRFVRNLRPSKESDRPDRSGIDRDEAGDERGRGAGVARLALAQSGLVPNLWRLVLEGFTREGKRQDVLTTLDKIERLGYSTVKMTPPAMLHFALQDDDTEAVTSWFWQYWRTIEESPDEQAIDVASSRAIWLNRVLSWCLQRKELAMGHDIVRQILADSPPKEYWDAILVWAAGTGKGADEIDRMLGVMEASSRTSHGPDIATINALVEFAITKNDPYLAERFIAIGKQRNIQPDARTCVLQMQYRLKVNDVDGALVAYTSLQSMDISDNEDVPTVNELIVALCNSKRHDFDTIMNVAADLSDRRVPFQPATISALALLHLNRDEVHDVLDLLNTHAHHYGSEQRQSIRQSIFEFCLAPKTPTSRAWDGYTILRSIFDEMARPQRTELMISFFNRERPDMATHIFGSMRTHSRADTMPTMDTYAAAFLACAKLRDVDVLEVIHNQLKLDYNIDSTTYLHNTLMIGYTACGKPRRALEFWDDIVASKEGPTYNSIHIALRACEKSAFGDIKAQEIWRRLRLTSVELDPSMWASFAAALVGNGDVGLALSTIEEAESKEEVDIDAFLVGSLLNGCPGQAKQEEVEAWIKETHPQVWTELEQIGIETDEGGMRTVKIDRSVSP